jgi:catechol 2,3-dioxygenase-like lactoylglutathione lyase family enzyme
MPKPTIRKSAAGRRRPVAPAKTAAITRKRRLAGRQAADTRKRRSAAAKALTTRRARDAATVTTRGAHLSGSNIIAFLATANGPRARTFYQSVIGLRLVADDPFALVFDANGVMVRIQKVETVTPVAYTALGWNVADILATIRSLTAKGVELERYGGLGQDDLGVWTSPSGARIAWFKDPDGHILSLTQW